jgi:hypothetical protein
LHPKWLWLISKADVPLSSRARARHVVFLPNTNRHEWNAEARSSSTVIPLLATAAVANILISTSWRSCFDTLCPMKTQSLRTPRFPVLLAFGGFALSPMAQGVNPPPDGGYPGGNTAEGTSALFSLTGGNYNTAVGLFSLLCNTDGNFNTAIGAGSLLLNTADENTATGAGALLSNISGTANTADGAFALFNNTGGTNTGDPTGVFFGSFNTATGNRALFSNTNGNSNTATGAEVAPTLVGRNEKGQPESVRYEQINAMLLNEFLKEHARGEEQDRKIQEQQATIAELKQDVDILVDRLKEHDSKIQRATAQMQMLNAVTQMVVDD